MVDKVLEFEILSNWNVYGNNSKGLHLSFTTKIDDWKKNVIFYSKEVGQEKIFALLNFLTEREGEEEICDGWTFSARVRGKWMNAIFFDHIYWVKDKDGKFLINKEQNKEQAS